jgi:DNA-binding XRE family transcriptional regulator
MIMAGFSDHGVVQRSRWNSTIKLVSPVNWAFNFVSQVRQISNFCIICDMPSKKQPVYPNEQRLLTELGERLRLARMRRKFSSETVAARSSISRMTLYRVERGDPSVLMVTYVRVLATLQLEEDLGLIAKEDRLGRSLQDLDLPHGRTLHAR